MIARDRNTISKENLEYKFVDERSAKLSRMLNELSEGNLFDVDGEPVIYVTNWKINEILAWYHVEVKECTIDKEFFEKLANENFRLIEILYMPNRKILELSFTYTLMRD